MTSSDEGDLAAIQAQRELNYSIASSHKLADDPIVAAVLANAKARDAVFFVALAELNTERSFFRMWRTHRHFEEASAAADQAHAALGLAIGLLVSSSDRKTNVTLHN